MSPDSVETELGIIIVADRAHDWPVKHPVKLLLRPDDLLNHHAGHPQAVVIHKAFKGAEIMYTLRLNTGIEVLCLFPSHHDHDIGEQVRLQVTRDHMVIFRADD